MSLQEKVGLEANGVVGPITAAALAADPAELSKPEPAKPDEPDEEDGFASILGGLGLTPDEK